MCAYDASKPVTGSSPVAADIRENYRALKEDGIVLPKTGTGATDACAGNDARLSDERTPPDGSVALDKLENYAVGAVLLTGASTERVENTVAGSYKKDISIARSGTLRIKFSLKCGNPGGGRYAHAQIYRNTTAVGIARQTGYNTFIEYSEDIAGWSTRDSVKLKVWCSIVNDAATVKDFKLYYQGNLKDTEVVNTN